MFALDQLGLRAAMARTEIETTKSAQISQIN